MSLALADAVNVLLADPSFSVAGTFTAKPSGSLINCRAIISRQDPEIRVGGAHALAPAWAVILNQAEVAARPKQGDIVGILEGPWAGIYVVHRTNEDTFAPQWDLEVGGRAIMPDIGKLFLRPRVGVSLTIVDATHVRFPDIPDAAGVVIVINTEPLRPVPGIPAMNEFHLVPGSDTATVGPGTIDVLNDVAWGIYFT